MSSPVPWADACALLVAAAPVPAGRLYFENETFAPPDDGLAWVFVSAVGDPVLPVELGGHVWQETGTIHCRVCVPTGTGSTAARVVGKAIADAFRGLPPRAVVYTGAQIGSGGGGENDDGIWWFLEVAVDYRYQDLSP